MFRENNGRDGRYICTHCVVGLLLPLVLNTTPSGRRGEPALHLKPQAGPWPSSALPGPPAALGRDAGITLHAQPKEQGGFRARLRLSTPMPAARSPRTLPCAAGLPLPSARQLFAQRKGASLENINHGDAFAKNLRGFFVVVVFTMFRTKPRLLLLDGSSLQPNSPSTSLGLCTCRPAHTP